MNTWLRSVLLAAAGASLVAPGCSGNVNDDSIGLVNIRLGSVSAGGQVGNNSSSESDLSADGRYVVFRSSSTNLDPRDSNTISDIYVRDLVAGTTQLVSVNDAGTGSGNNFSDSPRISPDGRFVVWNSQSTNLTSLPDNNGTSGDIFCRDLQTGITIPVSLNAAETGTHQFGTFNRADVTSDATNVYVAYNQSTSAGNEIVGTVTGQQVYVRRIPIATFGTVSTGTVFLVSENLAATGGGNSSSNDPVLGTDATNLYIAWESFATNLSAQDLDGTQDVYWRSMVKATGVLGPTALVSVNDAGTAGGSDGGGPPVFQQSSNPAISDDGRWVAFQSEAVDLLPAGADANGSSDIYVRGDLIGGPVDTVRASLSNSGAETTSDSFNPGISANGNLVVFESTDPNLVGSDSNGVADVFRRNLSAGTTERISVTLFGGEPNAQSSVPAISGDGQFVSFESNASNIIGSSVTFSEQIYVRGP